MRTSRTITTAVALALLGAGCAWLEPGKPEPEPFASHIVESQRLRSVMKQLLALVPEDPVAIAAAPPNIAAVREEIRNVSLALADQSVSIDNALARRELPASQREKFHALAATLRDRADALAEDAETLSAEELRARFDDVLTTCHSCHDQFRGAHGG